MAAEYLHKFGFFQIQEFENEKQALFYLKRHHQEGGIIISEWDMPELNGVELLHACKKTKELAEIRFLIITRQSPLESIKIEQAASSKS
jgi:response regulator RpfG family c-di-GMP phosphodiesterase